MHQLLHSGEQGVGVKFIYSLTAENVFCGVTMDNKTGALYPVIDIIYPQDDLPTVYSIVKTMGVRRINPEVMIRRANEIAQVVVFFRIKPMEPEALKEIFPEVQIPEWFSNEEIEFLMTGETELRDEDVRSFLSYYAEHRSFRVNISLPIGGQEMACIWGVELESFWDHTPDFIPQA